MIYPIVVYGDPILKKRAQNIEKDEIDLPTLVEDMFETMYNAHGVGLAAPQIGKGLRIFVVDGQPMDDAEEDEDDMKGFKKVFVNPEILQEEGDEWSFEEGCLSIPGIREEVFRNEVIKIRYYDEHWNEQEEVYNGIKARIIQHEYDHIEGILFTDHLSAFKKRLLKSKLSNISKGNVSADYRISVPVKR